MPADGKSCRRSGLRADRDPGPPVPAPLPRHVGTDGLRAGAHRPRNGLPRRRQPAAAAAADDGQGGGAFWEGIEAMGGRRLSPKQSVDALEQAIVELREFWRGEGKFEGPPPAHEIAIWVGAY